MAHPFHRLLPLFPIFLLPTHSLPVANRTQSVIPAHSVLGFPPSLRYDPVGHSGPLGLWRVFLSLLPRCSLGSVGHSGPLNPLLPLYLFSLLFSLLLHHRLDSVGHSGPLGLWQLPRSSLLLPSPFFHLVSPKPEPSRSFRPTRFLAASFLVLPLALPPLSPFSYFFSTARTQWVFPAHGLLQPPLSSLLPPSSLFYLSLNPVGHSGPLGSWLPPTFCPLQLSRDSLLSQPPPSRSFRPTRLLASPRNIARGSGTGTLRW